MRGSASKLKGTNIHPTYAQWNVHHFKTFHTIYHKLLQEAWVWTAHGEAAESKHSWKYRRIDEQKGIQTKKFPLKRHPSVMFTCSYLLWSPIWLQIRRLCLNKPRVEARPAKYIVTQHSKHRNISMQINMVKKWQNFDAS